MPTMTLLPNLPKGVRGIFNLRDEITPALDLSYFLFGFHNEAPNLKMIVTEFNNLRFGFIVNDVHRIHRFSWQQVEAPDVLHDFEADSSTVIGIIKAEDRNILMIDVEKIVTEVDPRLGLEDVVRAREFHGKDYIVFTAEDSPTIRKMLNSRLEIAGFHIKSYHDGMAAWNALAEIAAGEDPVNEHLHLIVTDIEMPRMDGYSLTKNIKSHPRLSNVPVVIFSSLVNEDVLHKGRSVGADAQLTKPQVSMLLDTIIDLIKRTYWE
jgi:two-component system chemotaxis response regulator CheV